jgi:hypothetical protein
MALHQKRREWFTGLWYNTNEVKENSKISYPTQQAVGHYGNFPFGFGIFLT